MKKLISLICAVAILFTAFGAVGVAAADDTISFVMSDVSQSKFTAYYNTKTNAVTIDGYGKLCAPVTFIRQLDSFNPQNITSLNINEGATVIGIKDLGIIGDPSVEYGLEIYAKQYKLINLKEITIPKTTKRVLAGVFKNATAVEKINYGGSKEDWDKIVFDVGNEKITQCKNINYNVDIPVSKGAENYVDERYDTEKRGSEVTITLDYYTGDMTVSGSGALPYYYEFLGPEGYDVAFSDKFCPFVENEYAWEFTQGYSMFAKKLIVKDFNEIKADALKGFLDATQGTSIVIPKSVKVIGGHMANTHPKVYYEGSKEDWKKIKFENTSYGIEEDFSQEHFDEMNCLRSANVHYTVPTKDDHIPDTPKMVSVKSTTNGIEVRWESTFGASRGYRVYRREAGKGWQYLKTVHKLGYHDSEIKKDSGKIFRYTVKAVGQTKLSNCEKGILIRYVQPSNIKRLENHTNGIKIFWHSIKNADSYRVYRKLADGKQRSWKYLTTVDADTTQYFDKEVKNCSGKKYAYCIRTVDKGIYSVPGSSTWSSYTRLATPDVKKAVNVRDGVKVTWKEVEGAEKYNVYRRGAGGSWKLISTVKSTSYIDKSVKNAKDGTPYRYTVKAVVGNLSKSGCEKGAFVRIK